MHQVMPSRRVVDGLPQYQGRGDVAERFAQNFEGWQDPRGA